MNAMRQVTAVLIFVMSLLMSGCGAGQRIGPTMTPIPTLPSTPTSLPASTPTPASDPTVLTLQATADLLKLLDTWDGKYVIFVNKNTDIKTLEDLNGKNIFCDMYTFGMETAVNDMAAFKTAAGVQMEIGLGNNMPQFFDQMAGDKNLVAFIPKAEADSNSLQDNLNLKTVVFE